MLGVGHCAAACDRNGDEKTRVERAVDESLSGKTALACALAMQAQRSRVLRGETEPTSLRWDNILWETEDDPSSVFFGEKHAHCSSLERKNSLATMREPRREKSEHRTKVHRSNNGARCSRGIAHARREFCYPHRAHLLCQPCSEGSLCTSQHRCDLREPTTKSQHCSVVRTVAEHSKLDGPERVTDRGPGSVLAT